MKRMSKSVILAALLFCSAAASAQSIFDFDFPDFNPVPLPSYDKPYHFDYDVDFTYYFDLRDYRASDDIFGVSEIINVARLTPSGGLRIDTGGKLTHKVFAGIDITKDLGANPISIASYSEEDDPALRNLRLFQDIFYYYNLGARTRLGTAGLYLGIFPRTAMEGEYSRVFFSDVTKLYDPNIEGLFAKYRSPRLYAEIGYDMLGYKEIERRERYMVFSAGSYSPIDWLSAGWAASYLRVGSSYFTSCNVEEALVNPYVKIDGGYLVGMDELSLKAGAIASYQRDHRISESAHYPIGAEGVVTLRHCGAGVENTLYYGDNMMPFRSYTYTSEHNTSSYVNLLYLGELEYFTHRGYPAFYDRLEVFYEPRIADFLKARVSGVGHFINKSSSYGPLIGWQAKASLIFDLEAVRHPAPAVSSPKSKKKKNQGPTGPSVIL